VWGTSLLADSCSSHVAGTLPNTRVQRTRSSPSALRSPLTRHPLGSTLWQIVLFSSVAAVADSSTVTGARVVPEPLQVKASHMEYSADMSPLWRLEINSPGSSTLLLFSRIERREQPLAVPPERLEALRETVKRERFFDLRESYGEMPVDGPERRIEIRQGLLHRTVSIFSLEPGVKMSTAERGEVARALRVWIAIRSCFDAPGALDSRPEDKKFLKAVASAA
jgi:hypothetical protein